MWSLRQSSYGAVHPNSFSYLLHSNLSSCLSPSLSLSFRFHGILISRLHMSNGMKLKTFCWALSGERENVILRARRTVIHFGSAALTHNTQGHSIFLTKSKKWLAPYFTWRMKCKGSTHPRASTLKGKMKLQHGIRSKFAQLISLSLYGSQVCTGVIRWARELCFSNRGKFVRDLKAL